MLERYECLDINNDSHIWLLHFLFLGVINYEVTEWAEIWNSHTMSLHGTRNQSPTELFYFGNIQHGVRGRPMYADDEEDMPEEELSEYGIDWMDMDSEPIRRHYLDNNTDAGDGDPAETEVLRPTRFSEVRVSQIDSPLTDDQRLLLESHLSGHGGNLYDASMHVRRLAWAEALSFCKDLAARETAL